MNNEKKTAAQPDAYATFVQLRAELNAPGYCCGAKYTESEAFNLAIAISHSAGGLPPDADWLWVKLMDWCKLRRVSPANYNDLFAIVKSARSAMEIKDEVTA